MGFKDFALIFLVIFFIGVITWQSFEMGIAEVKMQSTCVLEANKNPLGAGW